MGSPVSSVVANLFMEDFEERAMAEAGNLRPSSWDRYVDDVFSICKKDYVEVFLHYLNGRDPNIQFTMEMERDGMLPFLDIQAQRTTEGLVQTSVYRKPTHSGRVLSFQSHHPMNAKRATAKALFNRVSTHYHEEDKEGRDKEKLVITEELLNNDYDRAFVQKCWAEKTVGGKKTRTKFDHKSWCAICAWSERTH